MAANINFQRGYVIDASYLLAFLLPDEINKESDKFFDKVKDADIKVYAPDLMVYEIGNALAVSVIRKRLTPEQSERIMSDFMKLDINFMPINELETLKLSIEKKISYYDSSYLWLSINLNIPLMSFDKKLTNLG